MSAFINQEMTAQQLHEKFPMFLLIYSDEYREELLSHVIYDTHAAILSHYSTSDFNDNIWRVITHEGRREAIINLSKYDFKEHELNLMKCFCVDYISTYSSVSSVKNHLKNIVLLLFFLRERNQSIGELTSALLQCFALWLKDTKKLNPDKRNGVLTSVDKLIYFMKNNELLVPRRIAIPPRKKTTSVKKVEAPEAANMIELDRYFFDFVKPLSADVRLTYMLLRVMPNRISEVLDIHISRCLISDELFTLKIPTRKETAMHMAKMKSFSFIKSGAVERFVFQAVEEQLQYAQKMQQSVREKDKGYLMVSQNRPNRLLSAYEFNAALITVVEELGLTNFDGQPAHITSHDLRHAIVANYLDGKASLEDVQKMAGHVTPAATIGYGTPAKSDFLKFDREMKRELHGVSQYAGDNSKSTTEPQIISAKRFDMLKNAAQTRLLDEKSLCVQTSCTPQYEHCFVCEDFIPDPDCASLINYHCRDLEKRIERLLHKGDTALLSFNEEQLVLYKYYLKRLKGAD